MGQSSSSRSRCNNLRDSSISDHSADSQSVVLPSSTSGVSPPPPFPRPAPNHHIPSAASRFSPPPPSPPPIPPPPPPPPSNYAFAANSSYSPSPYGQPNLCPPPPSNVYPRFNVGGYMPVMTNRPSYPFYPNGNINWSGVPPMPVTPPFPSSPPPFVESQQVTRIRNEVNLHKNSIKIELDEENPDQYLVNFTFDAMVDGSITICYFAKEGTNCSFSPHYPEIHMPVRIPFQKGLGQKFHQTSGTGIDLGFFDLNDLSKPEENDVFPLVISAEAFVPPLPANAHLGQTPTSGPTQVTKAVIEKKNDEPFQVKVIKQMLWVDRVCYELQEIYGLGNSMKEDTSGDDGGKDCVICLSEPRDTTVMPCRHMCMCRECAKLLRLQSNRCPICRQPVDELLEIDVRNTD